MKSLAIFPRQKLHELHLKLQALLALRCVHGSISHWMTLGKKMMLEMQGQNAWVLNLAQQGDPLPLLAGVDGF